jgi:integrase
MASVFKRRDRWYVKFKDANGRWCTRSTRAETKAEAKRLGFDRERQAERRRLGLEPAAVDDGVVLGDVLRWWENEYFRQTSAYPQSCGTFRKHLLGADIAKLRVQEVTTGRVEQFI